MMFISDTKDLPFANHVQLFNNVPFIYKLLFTIYIWYYIWCFF